MNNHSSSNVYNGRCWFIRLQSAINVTMERLRITKIILHFSCLRNVGIHLLIIRLLYISSASQLFHKHPRTSSPLPGVVKKSACIRKFSQLGTSFNGKKLKTPTWAVPFSSLTRLPSSSSLNATNTSLFSTFSLSHSLVM